MSVSVCGHVHISESGHDLVHVVCCVQTSVIVCVGIVCESVTLSGCVPVYMHNMVSYVSVRFVRV